MINQIQSQTCCFNHVVRFLPRLRIALVAILIISVWNDGSGLFSVTSIADERPNVLMILADDLGFSDLGCYGGEIKTPNLDSLAARGLRFTQFYNTGRCWPTRAAIMTGYYPHQVRRDAVPGIRSGGRGKRPNWAPLISVKLRQIGYRTYHSGKWHIDGMPLQNGFDKSYYLRDQGRFFNPKVHFKDDKKLSAIEKGTDFYGTTAIAAHAIECLKDHQTNHKERPFFHYLAFTAPHFPLHARQEDIAKYLDVYKDDWQKFRNERFERLTSLGFIKSNLSEVERNLGPPYHFPKALEILGEGEVNRPLPWDKLTKTQKDFQSTKMAIHAAMIDCMDREIGKVIDQLKKMKALENTLIFFLSDNGASAEIMVRDDGHDPKAKPGSAETYLCLGPVWSTTCNTPFRKHKTWVHEGGIATPLIAHWPKGIKDRGKLRSTPGHAIDLAPTILKLAKFKENAAEIDQNRPDAPGKSLVAAFEKDVEIQRSELWWLHENNKAIRKGDWKLVRSKAEPWELYNLKQDRAETKNLADKHPEIVKRLSDAWQQKFKQFQADAKRDLTKESTRKKSR